MLVSRQKRSAESWDGTWMAYVPWFTAQYWPVTALDGCPPSAGGLNRGSAHAPVQVGGSPGSDRTLSRLSL